MKIVIDIISEKDQQLTVEQQDRILEAASECLQADCDASIAIVS